jgi:hypothetical protein
MVARVLGMILPNVDNSVVGVRRLSTDSVRRVTFIMAVAFHRSVESAWRISMNRGKQPSYRSCTAWVVAAATVALDQAYHANVIPLTG